MEITPYPKIDPSIPENTTPVFQRIPHLYSREYHTCIPENTTPVFPRIPPLYPRGKTKRRYYYYYLHATYSRYYVVSMCSSSLSLIRSCVSILTLQWLSSPHSLVQHGESHDTLQ